MKQANAVTSPVGSEEIKPRALDWHQLTPGAFKRKGSGSLLGLIASCPIDGGEEPGTGSSGTSPSTCTASSPLLPGNPRYLYSKHPSLVHSPPSLPPPPRHVVCRRPTHYLLPNVFKISLCLGTDQRKRLSSPE